MFDIPVMYKKTEVKILGKKYYFEFDNNSYREFEKISQKSIYGLYDDLAEGKAIKQEHIETMVLCGLKKHHSAEEICELESNLQENTNLWIDVGAAVKVAFMLAMLHPALAQEMYLKYESNCLKKIMLKIRNWVNSLL